MATIPECFAPKPVVKDEYKDPGENPFLDWPSATTPWELLELYTKCHMWKHNPFVRFDRNRFLKSHPKRKEAAQWSEFREPPQEEMLSTFFTSTGKPRLFRLGQRFDWWLFWAVTNGFYRMDKNKRTYTYVGEHVPTILDFKDSKGFWDNCSDGVGFPILRDITEACNRLMAAVLAKLSRWQKRTKTVVCYLDNMIRLPEMVMFQSYRGHDHKQYRWHYQPGPRCGGRAAKVARPMQIPKHSVHWMMMNYHLWLPSLKNTR